MCTRRAVATTLGLIGAGTLWGGAKSAFAGTGGRSAWRMPDESAPHQRTWMAFGASEQIWGRRLLPEVQRNLATIAQTIGVISAAVNEQASGLQQVSSAVVQMDRVTQENASMVQRTTDAARLLTEESDALANLAARFHVGDATEVRRPAAA